MTPMIYNSFAPISENDMIAFEAKIGHRLPEDYRQFLLQHNGGFCRPRTFNYIEGADGEQIGGVRKFFGIIDEDTFDSILKQLEYARGEISSSFLPIARDGVGNDIDIGLSGDQRGKIFYRLHEIDPSYGNSFFVANSFSEFLNSLYEYIEEDE